MNPINSIPEFISYLLPGFIALQIFRWVYPVKKRDQFETITLCLLLAVLLFNSVKLIDQRYLKNILESNSSGFPNFLFTLSLMLSGVLGGLILVAITEFSNWLGRKVNFLNFLISNPDTVWQKINNKKNQYWALVFLENDIIYLGWIKYYTFFPDSNEHEFLLTKAKRVDEKLNVIYEINGLGVYLSLSEVKRIELLDGVTNSITHNSK